MGGGEELDFRVNDIDKQNGTLKYGKIVSVQVIGSLKKTLKSSHILPVSGKPTNNSK